MTPTIDEYSWCYIMICLARHNLTKVILTYTYNRLRPYDSYTDNKFPWYDEADVGPMRIQDGFPGLPAYLDATVENINNANQLYAFKGDKYYV